MKNLDLPLILSSQYSPALHCPQRAREDWSILWPPWMDKIGLNLYRPAAPDVRGTSAKLSQTPHHQGKTVLSARQCQVSQPKVLQSLNFSFWWCFSHALQKLFPPDPGTVYDRVGYLRGAREPGSQKILELTGNPWRLFQITLILSHSLFDITLFWAKCQKISRGFQ